MILLLSNQKTKHHQITNRCGNSIQNWRNEMSESNLILCLFVLSFALLIFAIAFSFGIHFHFHFRFHLYFYENPRLKFNKWLCSISIQCLYWKTQGKPALNGVFYCHHRCSFVLVLNIQTKLFLNPNELVGCFGTQSIQ